MSRRVDGALRTIRSGLRCPSTVGSTARAPLNPPFRRTRLLGCVCGRNDRADVTRDRRRPGLARGELRRECGRPSAGCCSARRSRCRPAGASGGRAARRRARTPSRSAGRRPRPRPCRGAGGTRSSDADADAGSARARSAPPVRQRMRPRLIDAAHRPPAPGEVAVQVDAVRVLARTGSNAVRVQVGDDPEIEVGR